MDPEINEKLKCDYGKNTNSDKAAITRATFSGENRHFAFFLSHIANVTFTV